MSNKSGSQGSNGSADDRSLDLFQDGPVSDEPGSNEVSEISLADFAERAYLDYAVSVVKGRAIPDLCDGMKPVQRRILFAMDQMGLGNSAKPVKSARVVGDVLGKYHPHGDQSAYDALVRLAQDFSMRYPLIDGQGNFGSRDGDGAAAMRYTEARLTAFSELLLSEIDEGTVDFGPNYDGSFKEPLRLPARLPVCLLNGASGIAVGMATEIPPHNLQEVSTAVRLLLDQASVTDDELLACIAGPDFPGGGQITSSAEEIRQVYRQGRGSLKLRARWVFEELARAQWQLVITELPHGVSSQRILEEIEELTNPKIKAGKKSLSPEQQQTKQLMLSYCESVRDESGKEAAVRLVFEPKTSRLDREEFARLLLAQTSLETSFSANLVAVDTQGRPRSLSLTEMLRQWVDFRLLTVRRRSAHRLEIAQRRIHILEGRVIALASIDEVIAVIRESDEPKPALVARFGLTELQAEDILELRLRQLARLEAIKIEKELKELRDQADKLSQILDNERTLRKTVSKEISEDTKRFGDARRTLVKAEVKATVEIPVVDDPVTVVVSVNGWVRSRQGHGHDSQSFSFKTGDSLYAAFECRTTDQLVALSAT
ncbi:MAG: DNA topoisomerase IV subunit A, partial [Burkholderiaceae bacterium]